MVIETLIGSASEGGADAGGAVGGYGNVLAARACGRGLDGPAGHDADGVAPVALACADVRDRRGICARSGRDGGERLLGERLADDGGLRAGRAHDGRGDGRQRDTAGLDVPVAVERDEGSGGDHPDLHRAPGLQPQVRAAGAGGQRGHADAHEQLAVAGGGATRAGPELGQRHVAGAVLRAELDLGAQHEERGAGVHRGRRVHDVAADGADIARRGGPHERTAVGEARPGGVHVGVRLDLGVVDERAHDQRPVLDRDVPELADAVDCDEVAREGRLAVAGRDDEIRAARDGARPVGHGGEGLVERGGCGVAHEPTSCMCSHTRSGVIGSCRSAPPVSLESAFAIAAAVATFGASATPLEPRGPPSVALVCTHLTVIGGASGIVWSLYSSSAALRWRPSSSYFVPSESAWPMPIMTPPSTWPSAPISLMIVPESCEHETSSTRTTPVSRSSLTRTAWQLTWGADQASMPSLPTQL